MTKVAKKTANKKVIKKKASVSMETENKKNTKKVSKKTSTSKKITKKAVKKSVVKKTEPKKVAKKTTKKMVVKKESVKKVAKKTVKKSESNSQTVGEMASQDANNLPPEEFTTVLLKQLYDALTEAPLTHVESLRAMVNIFITRVMVKDQVGANPETYDIVANLSDLMRTSVDFDDAEPLQSEIIKLIKPINK